MRTEGVLIILFLALPFFSFGQRALSDNKILEKGQSPYNIVLEKRSISGSNALERGPLSGNEAVKRRITNSNDSLERRPLFGNEALERVQLYLEHYFEDNVEVSQTESYANALAYYEQLLKRPLNINKATKNDLEALLVLSDFQIESIVDYRVNSGYILSGTELSLLNGFDEDVVDFLVPFICFNESAGASSTYFGGKAGGKKVKDFNSNFLLKTSRVAKAEQWYKPITVQEYAKNPNSRYLGSPYFVQLRYKCLYNDSYSLGFTLENDSGEKVLGNNKIPFGDFFSFFIAAKDLKLGKSKNAFVIRNVVAGDFSVRFGQGLTAWNSFSLSSATTAGALYKRGAAIVPYSSADENNFFRGAGLSISKPFSSFNEFEISLFYSNKKIDARVNNGTYTSIIKDGKHNTQSSLQTRKILGENVLGLNTVLRLNKIKLGASWIDYGYDLLNARRVMQYNKYQMFYGRHGNVSLDFYWVFNKLRLYSEFAIDYNCSFSAIAGVIGRFDKWEWELNLRKYSKSYISPFSNAYSTISGCANQNGVVLSVNRLLGRYYKLSMGADAVYYPWYRYNIPDKTFMLRGWTRFEYNNEKTNWYLRLHDSFNSYNSANKTSLRGLYSYKFSSIFKLKLRGEVAQLDFTKLSYDLDSDFDFNLFDGRFKIQTRLVYYNCKQWDLRLYMYESDLPLSYNSQLLYGSGFRYYVLLSAKIRRFAELYLKVDSYPKVKLGLRIR